MLKIEQTFLNIGVRKRLISILFVLWSIALLTTTACSPGKYPGSNTSISIALSSSEVNSLVWIAENQGYFEDNGLNIDFTEYATGVAALEAVLNSEVDIATSSEFAFASQVLAGSNICTLGSINRSSTEYLVARIDRGIKVAEDLRGKTVGVPLGSRPEFALDRFLRYRGIDDSNVNLVNVSVANSVSALANGEVDAVTAWQPYINQMRDEMDDNLVICDVQEGQPSYTLLVCDSLWASENADLIVRFLKSIVQAEKYVEDNPDDAQSFIEEHYNLNQEYISCIWPQYQFTVSLGQDMVVAMEDQARWIVKKNPTTADRIPNFVKNIYFDGLTETKPEAISVIR